MYIFNFVKHLSFDGFSQRFILGAQQPRRVSATQAKGQGPQQKLVMRNRKDYPSFFISEINIHSSICTLGESNDFCRCDISVEIEITDKIYKLSKINGGKD